MTATPTPTLSFANLMEIDGEQVLFEALPSKDQNKQAAGMPDIMISVNLGWSFYEARVSLKLTEKGQEEVKDAHAFLVSTFTEDKAREHLGKIKSEFGATALVQRLLQSGEYDLGDEEDVADMTAMQSVEITPFAKLVEVEGRQVLAVARNDLGGTEDQDGLAIKVAQPDGRVMEARVEGLTLDDFSAQSAQHYVDLAKSTEQRKTLKP